MTLHDELQVHVGRMGTTQLWLLRVLSRKQVSHLVQKREVRVLVAGLQGGDESPTHGTGVLASFLGIGRGLVVLTTRHGNDISSRHLTADNGISVHVVGVRDLLENATDGGNGTTNVTSVVVHKGIQSPSSGVLPHIWLLDDTLGGVHERQVQSGTRVTTIVQGSQTTTLGQGLDHQVVHCVVQNRASSLEVKRVDARVEPVLLVSVLVRNQATVRRDMEEVRVVWSGILDKPLHGSDDVLPGGDSGQFTLVIGQDHHVVVGVAKVLVQETTHILHIINASTQLVLGAVVVDADQKSLTLTRTVGVLVGHV